MVGTYSTLAVAILTFGTALLAYLRSKANSKQIAVNTSQITEVHTAVNGKMDHALDRITQLISTMRAEGVPIPDAEKLVEDGIADMGSAHNVGERPSGNVPSK